MCLSDPETAILIGGEGANQQPCKDALWKLEIGENLGLKAACFKGWGPCTDNDFWSPVDLPPPGSLPLCPCGHTATYDQETKRIYVFGGMKEGKCCSTLCILDTAIWKWLLVTAKGKVPTLAYHSATIYHKELFIFGGNLPKMASLESRACSNMLYVFNPEYEIWYQPIVEGEKPLPRFGHSATLLRNKLVIFGGQRTSMYLNDVHILDLGESGTAPFL
ncbi:rho GTPase-activating protein gacHH-like [Carettochelys insculpta]|uniref:rho GTPase-activating protein gacHH-like n=1 Tax=Carettochelys insculpta TaxID=44489 RepID=UPI003EB99F6C